MIKYIEHPKICAQLTYDVVVTILDNVTHDTCQYTCHTDSYSLQALIRQYFRTEGINNFTNQQQIKYINAIP